MLVVVVIGTKERAGAQYRLELATLNPSAALTHAHAQAMKMAYLIGDPDTADDVRQYAAAQLVSAPSETWPSAVVGFDTRWSVNELAPYDDGTRAWIASGGGSLVDFDIKQNRVAAQVRSSIISMVWRRRLTGGPRWPPTRGMSTSFATVARRRWTWLPASTPEASYWRSRRTDCRRGSVDRRRLVGLDLTATGADRVHTSVWEEVLDVRPAAVGGAVALTRRGDKLAVFDPSNGRIRWQQVLPTDGLEAAPSHTAQEGCSDPATVRGN